MAVYREISGDVITIVNDRIYARNAVDPETAEALTAAFEAFDRDPALKVAVFYGNGGAFCGGWDLKYASTLDSREAFEDFAAPLAFPYGTAARPRGACASPGWWGWGGRWKSS